MSLGEHLTELRRRLILCLLAFVMISLLGMLFYARLWSAIRIPLDLAAESLGRPSSELVPFQWLAPMDGLSALVRMDLILSVLVTLPLWLHQAWCFVAPGLTTRERSVIAAAFTFGSGLFLLGSAVAFFWGVPISLRWLMDLNASLEGAVNQWTLDGYLGFLVMVMVGFGLSFELPLVMYILGRFGLIDPSRLRRYWRHTILVILVAAAAFTPPDPVTMVLLSAVLLLLYGAGCLLVLWTRKK